MRTGVTGRYGPLLALAGAAVLLRLPFLAAPEGSDEGGYLTIGRQWRGAGPSLYGHYWVDRPPLLIAIFDLSSWLGGLTALRVVGAVAAGVAVVGVAEASRVLAGNRAAVWSAAVAAALFVTPQLGTVQVNGELLAAPLVAWSIALTARAVQGERRAGPAAFGAGALAVAALLVKQNLAEALVFGAVTVLVARRSATISSSHVRRIVGAAAAGAAAVLGLVGAWTLTRGTSLTGVFDAMYPFRVRAAEVLATVPDSGQARRSALFLLAWLTSGTLLVVGLFAWAVLRGRVRGPAAWGLCATLVWAAASMLLGGGFWDHYLVELIVPVALAAGLVTGIPADGRSRAKAVSVLAVASVVLVALAHWGTGFHARLPSRGTDVGTAIAAVARPGDSLVSAFGDAETVESSGLSSPYPYLWTLPAQVDDPHLDRLRAVLAGPKAPTWLVLEGDGSFPAPVLQRFDAVVSGRYHPVGVVCGRTILVRDGVVRPAPRSDRPCVMRAA